MTVAQRRAATASLLYAELHGLPAILIHVGDAEIILDDSNRFGARARAAGMDVTLEAGTRCRGAMMRNERKRQIMLPAWLQNGRRFRRKSKNSSSDCMPGRARSAALSVELRPGRWPGRERPLGPAAGADAAAR